MPSAISVPLVPSNSSVRRTVNPLSHQRCADTLLHRLFPVSASICPFPFGSSGLDAATRRHISAPKGNCHGR